jgi:chorismate dehydratase
MSEKIRVSAVSYLNSIPFVYGLQHTRIIDQIDLALDYPAECARKLVDNEVDIGLVPVAIIPSLPYYDIISDFCIGAEGPVRTVVLLCNSPIETLDRIYLDYQSKTSVTLVKVLSKNLWKVNPEWMPYTPMHTLNDIDPYDGIVIIGDRVFEFESNFKYRYDLAEEWIRLTGLPFVFAAWTANKVIDASFLTTFNHSLKAGIENIEASIDCYPPIKISKAEAQQYFQKNISFNLTPLKKDGLKLFWSLAKEL